MPHFYFNVHDDEVATDPEGQHFDRFEDAVAQAALEARHLAADEILRTSALVLSHRIEITDSNGNVLGIVRFSDAIHVKPD